MSKNNFHTIFLEQSIFRFNENTPRIEKCLGTLTEVQIWQRPNASSNSVGNLILHLCGNIRQYIISSLGQQRDVRQRDAEFAAEGGWGREALLEKLHLTTTQAIQVITDCSEKELLRKRLVQGFDLTGAGIIIHVVEHYSYHTGQIAFWTKLLLDEDLGFYDGQDLGVKNKG